LWDFYVGDVSRDVVQVFDSSGNFQFGFGSRGTGDGQFINPASITADSNDNIYVTDINRDDVQVFSQDSTAVPFEAEGTMGLLALGGLLGYRYYKKHKQALNQ
jgi:DNA-binding beta-propeller fold protein YncE